MHIVGFFEGVDEPEDFFRVGEFQGDFNGSAEVLFGVVDLDAGVDKRRFDGGKVARGGHDFEPVAYFVDFFGTCL